MAANSTQTSDSQLVAACRAGDRVAYGALVERYFGTVWSIGLARLSQPSVADDLAQEVFLVAWLHLDSLAQPDRIGPWLSQIARRRAIDWRRRQQRASKLVAMVPMAELERVAANEEEPTMDRDQENQVVRQAVFALPDEQREVVLLKFSQGLNQSEIARRLGVHAATVGRQLDRALASMRTVLAPAVEESVRGLRPPPRMALRAALLAGTVAGMSGTSRAALVAAAGSAPKLAAVGTALHLLTGAKIAAVVAAAVVAAGSARWVIRAESPVAPQVTMPAPVAANAATAEIAAATEPAPSDEEMVLAAAKECFPRDVQDYLTGDALRRLANPLRPNHIYAMVTFDQGVSTLATAIDAKGNIWLGSAFTRVSDRSQFIDMFNTTTTGPCGLVTDTGLFITPDRTPISGDRFHLTAHVDEPWPKGTMKSFIEITQWRQRDYLAPDANGDYALQLYNYPGVRCVQQLVLIIPSDRKIVFSSERPAHTTVIGGRVAYVWQKHIGEALNEDYSVQLKLSRP